MNNKIKFLYMEAYKNKTKFEVRAHNFWSRPGYCPISYMGDSSDFLYCVLAAKNFPSISIKYKELKEAGLI